MPVMYTLVSASFVLWVLELGAFAQAPSAADIIEKRVPEPPSVGTRPLPVGIELAAPVPFPSVTKTRDGGLMMIGSGKATYSRDGGKTWSAVEKLSASVDYVIALQSGGIGGPVPEKPASSAAVAQGDLFFYASSDEGKTWERRGKITVAREAGWPYPKTMIQMRSGRLVLPDRFTDGAGHMGLYDASRSWGTLNGKMVPVEGHAHWPEPDIAFAYFSDDEGRTWQRSEGGIMIWHKEGYGGMWPCDEPSIIETGNAHLLMFCRTTLGRIYTSRSGPSEQVKPNGSVTRFTAGFDLPQPTPRIPKTGDILAVWNQVSGDEIRAGYRRGRLSSAISKDDGKTWQHFRTVDTAVLPPAGRVEPDPEPQMARGLDYVGVLPVLWFFGEEPAPAPGPKLVLRVPNGGRHDEVEIEAWFHEDRFFCHSRALGHYLRGPVGRLDKNLYGPVHQIITMLGWTPVYDRTRLEDSANPRLIVTVTPPQQ